MLFPRIVEYIRLHHIELLTFSNNNRSNTICSNESCQKNLFSIKRRENWVLPNIDDIIRSKITKPSTSSYRYILPKRIQNETSNESITNQNRFENIAKIGEVSKKIINNNVETIDCENIPTEDNIQNSNNENILMGLNINNLPIDITPNQLENSIACEHESTSLNTENFDFIDENLEFDLNTLPIDIFYGDLIINDDLIDDVSLLLCDENIPDDF